MRNDRSYMKERIEQLKIRFKKVLIIESRSLQELSAHIGISYPTILNFMNGEKISHSNVLKKIEQYIIQSEAEMKELLK